MAPGIKRKNHTNSELNNISHIYPITIYHIMKKSLTLIVAIICISLQVFAQKQIFESPKMKEVIAQHKLVAILPFNVTISYRKPPKNFDAEANHRLELERGKKVQASMYTYLLRRSAEYTVSFQDPEKTNVLLNRNKLMDSLEFHTKDEIAKALGVDAVMFGSYSQETTRSEAGAIVTTVLFGYSGKTGDGTLILQISNGSDGELLWRYNKSMDDDMWTSSDATIERQMRKLARNFPYSKEK